MTELLPWRCTLHRIQVQKQAFPSCIHTLMACLLAFALPWFVCDGTLSIKHLCDCTSLTTLLSTHFMRLVTYYDADCDCSSHSSSRRSSASSSTSIDSSSNSYSNCNSSSSNSSGVTPLYPGYKAQYRLYLLCVTVSLWHMNLSRLIYRSGGRAGLRLFTSDAATSKNAWEKCVWGKTVVVQLGD